MKYGKSGKLGMGSERKPISNADRDPIAIIGMACRLPGAPDLEGFWELLRSCGDAVGEMPDRSWLMRDDPSSRRGDICGGYLPDIDKFDANFFGFSPDEALRLDPQNRLLMEMVWDALEDAGVAAERMAGTRTGVYTSSLHSGYWDLLRAAGIFDLHGMVGAGPWQAIAGNISYQLDLRGPSMGLEATCATSLLAVHLACRALLAGEIEMAIVGAANLLLDVQVSGMLANAGLVSRTGRCRFGDAGGDGYIRSEGVAAVILKPYRRATADGDHIHALIAGTGASHDGRSGRTQFSPGLASQEMMLREAYADAGISPRDVDYVEAHGPGTPAGDPIELMALQRVMGEGRRQDEPCIVGSAKSNIGHCEAASGLVGLIKASLAIQHKMIPKTLHVVNPHPVLADGADGPDGLRALDLAVSAADWPYRGRPAIAGVSAFGVSGTNVHVVLCEPPTRGSRRHGVREQPWLLPLSARDPYALRKLARQYAERLGSDCTAADLRDVCFSAGTRRSHREFRLAVTGSTAQGIADQLRSFATGEGPGLAGVTGQAERPPRVVFVFPGQGAARQVRGAGLLAACSSFARRMRECDRALEAEVGWSASARLADDVGPMSIAESQPVAWAVQVSLAALWENWGIRPDAVVGHSMGEIAAATAAGALSLRDAAAVVCRRSKLLETLSGRGAMWSVQLGERAAQEAIAETPGEVCVGVINSEHSVVLTGDLEATTRVIDKLRGQLVSCTRIPVDATSHAPLVEELRPRMLAGLRSLRPRTARIPMHSTVTDRLVEGAELTASYWMENMRAPVRFLSATRSLLSGSGTGPPTLFVEISSHPTLVGAVEDTISSLGAPAASVPSLRPGCGELESMLASLGGAYTLGCFPDWGRLYRGGRYTRLPGYPWNRVSYWPSVIETGYQTAPPADRPAGHEGVRQAATRSVSMTALSEQVAAQLADILAVAPGTIDPFVPMARAGLDSFNALRLRERLQGDLGVQIQIRDLLGESTITGVARKLRGLMGSLTKDLCGRAGSNC